MCIGVCIVGKIHVQRSISLHFDGSMQNHQASSIYSHLFPSMKWMKISIKISRRCHKLCRLWFLFLSFNSSIFNIYCMLWRTMLQRRKIPIQPIHKNLKKRKKIVHGHKWGISFETRRFFFAVLSHYVHLIKRVATSIVVEHQCGWQSDYILKWLDLDGIKYTSYKCKRSFSLTPTSFIKSN